VYRETSTSQGTRDKRRSRARHDGVAAAYLVGDDQVARLDTADQGSGDAGDQDRAGSGLTAGAARADDGRHGRVHPIA